MKPKESHARQLAMITRRTTHRQFAWVAGEQTRELFGYMYGKALMDHGLDAHVAFLMSNHVHMMVYDNHGSRSSFMQQLFSNSARKRNKQINRRENLWATEKPGDMAVLDMDACVDQVLYVCMQAVAAGLEDKAENWTGFKILPSDWGKPMRFERPALCSDKMP